MDFIIVEYPDGLRVPTVSDPPIQIPHYNREIPNFLTAMISFVAIYLYDDGAFLLFYLDGSNERKEISSNVIIIISKSKMSGPSSIACTLQIW
jgi:hypothetical protein